MSTDSHRAVPRSAIQRYTLSESRRRRFVSVHCDLLQHQNPCLLQTKRRRSGTDHIRAADCNGACRKESAALFSVLRLLSNVHRQGALFDRTVSTIVRTRTRPLRAFTQRVWICLAGVNELFKVSGREQQRRNVHERSDDGWR